MNNGSGPVPVVPPAGDTVYLEKTLRYQDIDLSLSEAVSGRAVFRLWLRAASAGVIVFALFGIPSFFVTLASFSALTSGYSGEFDSSGPSDGSGLGTATVLFVIGMCVSIAVFWLVLLAIRITEPIAEWRVLLGDRWQSADAVYSQIAGTLGRRFIPLAWRVNRIRAGGTDRVTNRLVLWQPADPSYAAYVTVFPYGSSLYLGWTMWRSRRGATLIKQYVVDLCRGLGGYQDLQLQMMRIEPVRAMREAVHAACREGLFVGVEQVDVPVEFGFPQGMPGVEDQELASAPMPVSAPTR